MRLRYILLSNLDSVDSELLNFVNLDEANNNDKSPKALEVRLLLLWHVSSKILPDSRKVSLTSSFYI
jgi:hypothetical protein